MSVKKYLDHMRAMPSQKLAHAYYEVGGEHCAIGIIPGFGEALAKFRKYWHNADVNSYRISTLYDECVEVRNLLTDFGLTRNEAADIQQANDGVWEESDYLSPESRYWRVRGYVEAMMQAEVTATTAWKVQS
jgi:hypothetical protein